MILGVGIDMVKIERFERLTEKFLSRVFSCREREYLKSKGSAAAGSAAGIFCAKEALSKALGCGLTFRLLKEAEVVHDDKGKPYISLSGELGALYEDSSFHLSITHTDDTAAAVVILEKPETGIKGDAV